MRILVSWLRELVPVEADVQELADVLTMRGFEVSAVEPASVTERTGTSLVDDTVLDLEITTNRPDCLSVAGIAREIATVYDLEPSPPGVDPAPEGETGDVTVAIDDTELCPRYVAAVADVTPGPSPAWLADRLEAADVRPINNIVDVTNYVMLETGHPMHAFDLDRLGGRSLRIRRAAPGESIRTLDGKTRALDTDMLVIADADVAQAVAGVMGGADSEVSDTTRRIALESAYFRPTSVRRTSKRLALSTDASYRFERGADVHGPVPAMRRALTLLAATGAGHGAGSIIDEYPAPRPPTTITLRHHRIGRVLGLTIAPAFIEHTLARLGFEVVPADGTADDVGPTWQVTVPSFRVDVSREVDLVEEVARHHGYDRLPSTFPALIQAPAPPDASLRRQRVLRQTLTASGCSEAITYSFIERDAAAPFATGGPTEPQLVAIANPLSENHAVLRPSLLPGLMDSVVRNRRRERRDVWLFEIGKRFEPTQGETPGLGIIITGTVRPEHWSETERPVDLYDLKGVVERTCAAVGVTPEFEPTDDPVLVPGRAARIVGAADERTVTLGRLGQLRPDLATTRGFPTSGEEVYVAELELAEIEAVAVDPERMTATPVPRYPSIVRDLALLVDRALPAASLRGTIRSAAPATLVSIREFDRYAGKGVPSGLVSLAVRLTFRATDRTLTDHEIQTAVDGIVNEVAQRHGATLRE